MLTSITIIAVLGWIGSMAYDLLYPQVEEPRLHSISAIISVICLWDKYLWAAVIILVCATTYAILVTLHYYSERQERLLREEEEKTHEAKIIKMTGVGRSPVEED